MRRLREDKGGDFRRYFTNEALRISLYATKVLRKNGGSRAWGEIDRGDMEAACLLANKASKSFTP